MDQERRSLERAAASGDPDAEARLLVERVRAGELPEGWLEAAARLGHEPARRALGRWVPHLVPERLAPHLGPHLLTRLLAEVTAVGFTTSSTPAVATPAARAWSTSPTAETRAALLDALGPEPAADDPRRSLDKHARAVRSLLLGADAAPEDLSVGLLSAETWRAVRRAVVPFALRPPAAPPPRWPVEDLRSAWESAADAFDARLHSTEVVERAADVAARLARGELNRVLVEVAAELGDPAAWRVAGPRSRYPAFEAPRTAADLLSRFRGTILVGIELDSEGDLDGVPSWAESLAVVVIWSLEVLGLQLAPEDRQLALAPWDGGVLPVDLLAAVERAGAELEPGPVWQRLRADLVAWALGEAPAELPGGGSVRPYTPKGRYAVGDLVAHPKFGQGAVTRATKDKIDVEFTDGPRTLAHARSG